MKRPLAIFAAGLLLAFMASVAGAPGAYEYYRFKTGDFPRDRETAEIKSTIKFFGSTLAGFYSTGGSIAGLNIFPAEKMVKRRIFQDLRNWHDTGKLLVMDRDKSVVKQVQFIAPDRVIATADEDWFSVYQDYKTRRPISGKKANLITVRYFMKKQWGKWIVVDYEVHIQGEPLPPLSDERLWKW